MEDQNSKQANLDHTHGIRFKNHSHERSQSNILTRNRSKSYVKRNIHLNNQNNQNNQNNNNYQSPLASEQKDKYDLYKKQLLTQKFQNLQINLIPKTQKKPMKLKLDRIHKQNNHKNNIAKQIDKINKNIDKKIQDQNQMVKRSLEKMERLMTISLRKIQQKSKEKLQQKLNIIKNNNLNATNLTNLSNSNNNKSNNSNMNLNIKRQAQKKQSLIQICVDNKRISHSPKLILLRENDSHQIKQTIKQHQQQFQHQQQQQLNNKNSQNLHIQQNSQYLQSSEQYQQSQQYQQQQLLQDMNQKQTVKDRFINQNKDKNMIQQTLSEQKIVQKIDQNKQQLRMGQYQHTLKLKKNNQAKLKNYQYVDNSNTIKSSMIKNNIKVKQKKQSIFSMNIDMNIDTKQKNTKQKKNTININYNYPINNNNYVLQQLSSHKYSQILSLSKQQQQQLFRLTNLHQLTQVRKNLYESQKQNKQFQQIIANITKQNNQLKQQNEKLFKLNIKLKKDLNQIEIQYLQKIQMYNQLKYQYLKYDQQNQQNQQKYKQNEQISQNLLISMKDCERNKNKRIDVDDNQNDEGKNYGDKIKNNGNDNIKEFVSQIKKLIRQISKLEKQLEKQKNYTLQLKKKLQLLQKSHSKSQKKPRFVECSKNNKTSKIIEKLISTTNKNVHMKIISKNDLQSDRSQVSIKKQIQKKRYENVENSGNIQKTIENNFVNGISSINQNKDETINSPNKVDLTNNIKIDNSKHEEKQHKYNKKYQGSKSFKRPSQYHISICLQPQNQNISNSYKKSKQINQISQYTIQQTANNMSQHQNYQKNNQSIIKKSIYHNIKNQNNNENHHQNHLNIRYDRNHRSQISQQSDMNKYLNAVDYMTIRKKSISPHMFMIQQKTVPQKHNRNNIVFYSNQKFKQLKQIRQTISLKFQAFKYTFQIFQNQMILWPSSYANYKQLSKVLSQYPFFLQQPTIEVILEYCNLSEQKQFDNNINNSNIINYTIRIDRFCNKLKQFVGEYEQITEQQQLILQKKIHKRWRYTKDEVKQTFNKYETGEDQITKDKFEQILMEFKYQQKQIHHLLCQSVAISADIQHIKYREYFENFLSRK